MQTPWRLQRLIAAMGSAPDDGVEDVLRTLAADDPRFLESHEWLDALKRRHSTSSVLLILDLLGEGKFLTRARGADTWELGRYLAVEMEEKPEVRAEGVRALRRRQPG